MDPATDAFLRTIRAALGRPEVAVGAVAFTGDATLPSAFPVTALAAASIAAAGLAVADLVGDDTEARPALTVDRRLASLWFSTAIRPTGWALPALWDPVAGDYRARDGWIRLHTNAPHHRAAAERVLGAHADRTGMAAAVAEWTKTELEAAIVAQGGCAAEMRSAAEWRAHPQGVAVAAEPLVAFTDAVPGAPTVWRPDPTRPLAGVRVLDLTRVLAGPVATRFLAGYGAEVLRIDPPGWNEPGIEPDVTLGKRCARLDLRERDDRAVFERLLAHATILVHGYRADALDRLGYGDAVRRRLAPKLIDVRLDAYGWTGPWAGRRGFDSLVQMSCGLAQAGQAWQDAATPVPLPAQALDHATGYLLAATAVGLLARRRRDGTAGGARLSLARTAQMLLEAERGASRAPFPALRDADLAPAIEATGWGAARRLLPPLAIADAPMAWTLPARPLGGDPAAWARAVCGGYPIRAGGARR